MKKTNGGRVRRDGHVKSGVETGVMLPQVKDHPESPDVGRSQDRFSPGGNVALPTTMREYMSIVSDHLCVTLLQQP